MNKKQLFLLMLLVALSIGSISLFFYSSRQASAAREDLSASILRFHVLANSDSEADQTLKMEVKSAVLSYLESHLPKDADLAETKAFIEGHRAQIHALADRLIQEAGYNYSVSLYLEPWYFPTKSYGDLTFPCGTYEAFRIVIGAGEGKNWWCVLYPSLCFVDASYSIVPEDSKETLQGILKEDTYDMITENSGDSHWEKPEISFRLFELISSLF